MKKGFALFALAISLFIGAIAAAQTHDPVVAFVAANAVAYAYVVSSRGYSFGVVANAPGQLTLLDIAMRNGQNVAAIVEDVTTVAPEFSVVPAIIRGGTSYDVLRRTGYPAGGFRQVGAGVALNKSTWERETKPMYLFDCQMLIGEDIVKAQTAESMSTAGDVLADEAIAAVRGSTINIGSQMYYGAKAAANGFSGLATLFNDEIDAGGTSATTSVYLCWLDPNLTNPQGVHFAVGLAGAMNFGDWMKQQVDMGGGKKAMAYVNGFLFYLGFAAASALSIWRVRGVSIAHPFTDALGAQLLAKVPIARRQNLRWFMNKTAAFTLQSSRSTVYTAVQTGGGGIGGGGVFPQLPDSCMNIPITWTDSLLDTETSGNLV
jgi:hypothetical protein